MEEDSLITSPFLFTKSFTSPKCILWSSAIVLNWGQVCFQRQYLQTVLVVTTRGEGVVCTTGMQWGEAMDSTKHPKGSSGSKLSTVLRLRDAELSMAHRDHRNHYNLLPTCLYFCYLPYPHYFSSLLNLANFYSPFKDHLSHHIFKFSSIMFSRAFMNPLVRDCPLDSENIFITESQQSLEIMSSLTFS